MPSAPANRWPTRDRRGAGRARRALATVYPGQKSALQLYLKQSLDEAGIGPKVAKGIALGKQAAADILAARANDNSANEESYKEGTVAGQYRFVPGFDFVSMPHWRTVRPFALTSPAQFRVKPPPALSSTEYTRAFDEVMHKGGSKSIARTVSRDRPQDLWTSSGIRVGRGRRSSSRRCSWPATRSAQQIPRCRSG
jgi:hypothetical protein